MRTARWIRFLPAALALGAASLVVWPARSGAFTVIGHTLGLDQRDVRVFNNFADPESNDNTTPHPSWPGFTGAPMAIWKATVEWQSLLHGDGEGDPSQPGDLGSGGANFDPSWQGNAPGVGGSTENVVSAISNCGGGVTAFTEVGAGGWRIRLCDDLLWDDGPGVVLAPGAVDIQGIITHEYGHALGLGHTNIGGSTMFPSVSGGGVSIRSIAADDKAGVQFLYGAASPSKPRIDYVLVSGAAIDLVGSGFAPFGNSVWFTQAGVNPTGNPIQVGALTSTAGGTRIHAPLPASAGPGDVLVAVPGGSGASLSHAFPFDPSLCGDPTVYCTPKTNSLGCASAIGSSGTPSASAGSGFVVSAMNVLNQVFGILFYSKDGPASAPFQGGFLCVGGPLVRTPIQSSGGSPQPASDCSGSFALDFNAWIASGQDPALVAGSAVWAQHWSRDPGFAPPQNTNLSDALAFAVCP
jgi:hypothetical protein